MLFESPIHPVKIVLFGLTNTKYKSRNLRNLSIKQIIKPKPKSLVGQQFLMSKEANGQNQTEQISDIPTAKIRPQILTKLFAKFRGTTRTIMQSFRENDLRPKPSLNMRLAAD
jgi:hypothetical protein